MSTDEKRSLPGTPEGGSLSAFLRGLPLDFESIEPDWVTAWMDLGPDQHTPWGVVHGGAYTTAVESAASLGASAAVLDRGLQQIQWRRGGACSWWIRLSPTTTWWRT